MKFKFIGKYTGDRESVNVGGPAEKGGVMFFGREAANVENDELVRRLSNNPEFQKAGKEKAAKEPEEDGEITALRTQYEQIFGKKPFNGWNADKLREKLATE